MRRLLRNTKYLIKYYVFLCFLLGNDFIPHLSFLNFKSSGLETLLLYYKKISNEIKENIIFVTKNKKGYKYQINYNFITSLFNYLSKIEDKELFECSEQYYNKKQYNLWNWESIIFKLLQDYNGYINSKNSLKNIVLKKNLSQSGKE